MKSREPAGKLGAQIREEASDWFVAFCEDEVGTPGREAFDRWLRTSPEHIRAYLRISALWEGITLLSQNQQIAADELVRRARDEGNVVPLNQGGEDAAKQTIARHSTGLPRWRKLAIAASVLLLGAAAGWGVWVQLLRAPTYVTAVAEQRTIRLADGSTVQLDASSRIQVHFTSALRSVDLTDGQALFSVAKNPSRPFIVRTGQSQVRAVGTQFNVNRTRSGTIVTVIEGRVAILTDASQSPSGSQAGASRPVAATPIFVSAGEQALVDARVPAASHPTNVAVATAWTEGKLVFASTPLRDVVDAFNRTNPRRIIVEDEALLDFHISGVFPSSDPSRVVGLLQQRFGVTVQETEDEIRIGRP